MIKLTKQAISKLLTTDNISVRLINGLFYEAHTEAVFSRYKVTLDVAVVHPTLKTFTRIDSPRVVLVHWVGHTGLPIEVPEELTPLVKRLIQEATITEEQAEELMVDIRKALSELM